MKIFRYKLFIIFTLIFYFQSFFVVNAEESSKDNEGGPILKLPIPLEKPTYYLDKLKEEVGHTVVGFSNDVDSLFGDKSKGDVINGSLLKFSWLAVKVEGQEVSHSPEFDLRLVLPRTEKKLQVVVERRTKQVSDIFQDKESGKKSKTTETVVGDEDTILTAGVRYLITQGNNWNLYTEAGVKVKIPLQPFASLSGGRKFLLNESWSMNFRASLMWYLDQGLSETTVLNFDYPFKKNFLFRIGNSLTWVDETGQLNTSNGPRLYHKLDDKRGLRYFISALSKKNPKMNLYSYEGGAYYRELVYDDWITYETGVKGEFSRVNKWELVPSVSFKLEMLLGGT